MFVLEKQGNTGKLKISLNSHHPDDMQTVDMQNIKQITRQIVHRYVGTVSMMLEQWRFETLPQCKTRTENPSYSDLIHVYEKSWSLQSTK